MSFNQSRGEKNEAPQYRRSGRSVNPAFQRNFSGGGGGAKGGGGGSTTAPPSSSSGRSFKVNNNAQGVQPRASSQNTNVNLGSSNSSHADRGTVQNGAHLQPPVRVTGAIIKLSDVSNQKSTPGLPKAVQGNAVTPSSDATGLGTPIKGPTDASRSFPLQFGSISPGLMNGMQIPARTNSAPPNMDEQKQAQARLDSIKATTFSTPSVPKHQLPRKDTGTIDQSSANEAHPVPKLKKNVQASAIPPTTQTQKPSSHPIPGVPPMQPMPFHQPQLHVQFGGSNPQMQTQNTSMPMPLPMPLPMGNPAQVQQQVFVPGIQHHPMQSQGIIHQGQGINFSSQMGSPQMPPQMGNMGIGLGSQYSHQQTGKFGPRRTVKITHPDTHEELRLDKRMDGYADGGSSGPRSHPHGPPQSQPIPPFPHVHPMNYYPSSYNASPLFYPPPNSNLFTSAQITPGSQAAPRLFNQVTVRPASSSMDNPVLETSKSKGSTAKGKKKRKEILKNADAQGTTSDLYMAYKGPEEKKETLLAEISESPKKASVDSSEKEEKRGHSKFEPDDWEDAADISTPKLLKHHSEDGNDGMTKRYSRDFLLKFSEQCTDLPEGFEITSDIAEALIVSGSDVSRESYPSPGRAIDRSAGGPRLDRRTSNLGDEDKWSKNPGPLGYPGNVQGFRPGQGGNYGVLRNPRAQTPVQYGGGILSGPMQSPGAQVHRNNADSDRWQRATGYQKGLMPSPQTPMQVMHKAERKYEVGKVTDEEQAKQRQLKGILNKLTPQNFEKLFEQVTQVNIDNAGTLSGVIAQIFDKALTEPTFCEMYANFCSRLAVELPDFSKDNEKITFKRLLLNKCQEEFERGEREQEEANRTEEEGEVKQSEEEREEKRVKARRRMLGNIRLIGELYKKKMLTERIMHECIKKLLNYQNPDEEDIEALCKLMSTIGEMIDHHKAKEHMDVYFDTMSKLSNNMKLSSRVRFMLKDAIDLRKNKWQQRRKVEGPKKIDEVHRDAAQERQAQSSRLGRGPNLNSSLRRGQGQGQGQGQPMDFGPRGSNVLPSPNSQMGGFRGLPQQLRGYGNQDARFEERQSFENRTLSIPLRPIGDDSITLGPQGGLARGMSMRGQPTMQSMPLHEMPSPADSRRPAAGLNGYGSGPREDFVPRYAPERFAPPPAYDQLYTQERGMNYVNRDTRNSERVLPSSPPARVEVPTPQNVSSDKVFPEKRLHDMSMEAIKEFYSARDEMEVTQCIKDLNAPSFYPSMISIWVTDSFERKDMERDSLAKLLINLSKPQLGMLSQDSLVKGFESVLSTLEDAVNDAPKAAEFLGRIFARVLIEDVIPYKEAWRLIYEGGEEEGRLVEIGLAAEVLGVILEIIKSEKGDPFLNEICAGSNLEIHKFRPQNIKKSLRLDKFI